MLRTQLQPSARVASQQIVVVESELVRTLAG